MGPLLRVLHPGVAGKLPYCWAAYACRLRRYMPTLLFGYPLGVCRIWRVNRLDTDNGKLQPCVGAPRTRPPQQQAATMIKPRTRRRGHVKLGGSAQRSLRSDCSSNRACMEATGGQNAKEWPVDVRLSVRSLAWHGTIEEMGRPHRGPPGRPRVGWPPYAR